MPLYAYRCDDCDRGVAAMRLKEEREDGPECDRCGQPMKLMPEENDLKSVMRKLPLRLS